LVLVIPAQAGIQFWNAWIPASAGMTEEEDARAVSRFSLSSTMCH
jgi:hypothetical protein